MEASSATRRLLAGFMVRDWAWWRLPWPLRCYVGQEFGAALARGVMKFSTAGVALEVLLVSRLLESRAMVVKPPSELGALGVPKIYDCVFVSGQKRFIDRLKTTMGPS